MPPSFSIKSSLAKVLLVCSVSMFLYGCSAGGDSEALKNRVADLESENTALKHELATLKDSFAKAKISELQNALQPSKDNNAGTSKDGPNPTATIGAVPMAVTFIDLEEVPTKEMITELAQLNVFGELGNKFDPMKPITRAQYIEWLYKSYNAMEPGEKQLRFAPQLDQQFKDTPPRHPQYKYIQALSNAGYSIGYNDGTFRPDKPLTREEMLGIKVGVDVGKTLPPWRAQMENVWKFSDSKNVDEKFTGYVHQDFYVSGPHGSNIQRAFGKIGAFHPKQSVLRSEAAATLWQMGQFGDTQTTNAAAILKEKKQ